MGYASDHAWTEERIRCAGLEHALDDGTRAHLLRLGVGPGRRCIEVGAGGGAIARWLAERVLPDGTVVATDLETDFLEAQAARHPALEVLRHDIIAADLPTGFDLVVTIHEAAEPAALRRVVRAAMAHLEATCAVECTYGRRVLDDVSAAGLVETAAEGRGPSCAAMETPASVTLATPRATV